MLFFVGQHSLGIISIGPHAWLWRWHRLPLQVRAASEQEWVWRVVWVGQHSVNSSSTGAHAWLWCWHRILFQVRQLCTSCLSTRPAIVLRPVFGVVGASNAAAMCRLLHLLSSQEPL
jgi:hypothetical protein